MDERKRRGGLVGPVILIGLGIILLLSVMLFPFVWEVVWASLHDYQRERVMAFVDPDYDPAGKGYHALQSRIAIGSGELTGKGLYGGTQSQLKFLPEGHTDFVFAVLAEELGLVGAAGVIELHHAIALRVVDRVGEHGRPLLPLRSRPEAGCKIVPVKDIIAQYQGGEIISNERFTNDERLRETIGRRLYGVLDIQPPLVTRAE